MGFLLLARWWYTAGWVNSFFAIEKRVQKVANELSMGILLKTLFEPWKQITLYAGQNSSVDVKFHVLLDNIFSRFFGFFVRSFVLIFGVIALGVIFVFGCFLAIAWPLIPLLPLVCIGLAVAL
jgi:hypothetical protein